MQKNIFKTVSIGPNDLKKLFDGVFTKITEQKKGRKNLKCAIQFRHE